MRADLLSASLRGDGILTERLGVVVRPRVVFIEDVDTLHKRINIDVATTTICTRKYT